MSLAGVSPADIERAGRQIVRSALRLSAGDGLVVIGDEKSKALVESVAAAAEAEELLVWKVWLEELGRRPLPAIPDSVARRLSRARGSAFLASAPHQEMRMRQHLLALVATHQLRHAHMEGISERAFVYGMQGDYREISRVGRSMLEALARSGEIGSESRWGTDLKVSVTPGTTWFPELGEIEPSSWSALPSGALYCTPDRVDGVFVANGSLGEFFGLREGSLLESPVRMEIRRSKVVSVEAHSRKLQKDIESILSFGNNSDRVGLASIGVNLGMNQPTGEAHTDQNLPGLHLVIGDPASKVTGTDWSARTSFAACQADSSVMIGGELAIHEGVVVRN
jgi:leucyl aminopeptidase (aminopeptidase T)